MSVAEEMLTTSQRECIVFGYARQNYSHSVPMDLIKLFLGIYIQQNSLRSVSKDLCKLLLGFYDAQYHWKFNNDELETLKSLSFNEEIFSEIINYYNIKWQLTIKPTYIDDLSYICIYCELTPNRLST